MEKTLFEDIKKILKDQYNFSDQIIDQIYNKIVDCTNDRLNFEYYQCSYDDIIEDDVIEDFIENEVEKYYKDGFDSLEDAKITFSDYIYMKYFENCIFYYEDELARDLNIEISRKDGSIEYVDGCEVIRCLQENLGILDLEVDAFKLCKSDYRIVLYTKEDGSSFSTIFDGGRYKDEKNYIKELKRGSILQKLCKVHGFDVEDLYKYQNCKKGSKSEEKYIKIRSENKFFDELYKEFCNTFGYYEDITFLLKLSIEDILNFYVKGSKFNLKSTGSIGLYDSYVGSGSLFEVNCYKDCEVDCKDLVLQFYKGSSVESCYGFCDSVF